MTLIDDRCDGGCGRGFDPMGDPLLTRHPEIGPWAVFCQSCEASAVMTPVPNKPKTPLRSFRISDAVYDAAKAKAAEKGETLTDVVRRALERYAKR